MLPSVQDIYEVLEATWPAARRVTDGPWVIREGCGGGKRVSAATTDETITPEDLRTMETAMERLSQPPLVMVRDGKEKLDTILADAEYKREDPTYFYAAPVKEIAGPLPDLSAIPHWPWLAITAEIWDKGGIGPQRRAIMERVNGPKTLFLARSSDTPAGAAFVAAHKKTAMIHAIEIAPKYRRQGAARNIMRAAANWAQNMGATTLALAVTEQNTAARALYTSLGLCVVGKYHYRAKMPQKGPSGEKT